MKMPPYALAVFAACSLHAAEYGDNGAGFPTLVPGRFNPPATTNAPPVATNPPPVVITPTNTSPIVVTQSGYSVFAHPTNIVNTGGVITVTWINPDFPSTINLLDVVALYRVDVSPSQLILPPKQVTGRFGDTNFTITTPGIYQVVYLKFGLVPVATSSFIIVGVLTPPPPVGGSGPFIAAGDSLVSGDGSTGGSNVVFHLEQMTGLTIVNAGVSGNTTSNLLARLDRDVIARNPSGVLLIVGGKDILDKVPQEVTFANLDAIFGKLRSRNIPVVFVGVGDEFLPTVAGNYRFLASKHGVTLIPEGLQGIIGHRERMADLVHPNNEGYRLLAQKIAPYLRALPTDLPFLHISRAGSGIRIEWFARTNKSYVLGSKTTLKETGWNEIIRIPGQGSWTNVIMPIFRPDRFFSVQER